MFYATEDSKDVRSQLEYVVPKGPSYQNYVYMVLVHVLDVEELIKVSVLGEAMLSTALSISALIVKQTQV